MRSKYEGRKIHFLRNTKQTVTATKMSRVAEGILLCNVIFIYCRESQLLTLVLACCYLRPGRKIWFCLLLYLHEWSGLLRQTVIRYFSRPFSRSWEASWAFNIVDWAFSYLPLHSPLICSTSSSNVTELLLRGGQMQCGAWGPSELYSSRSIVSVPEKSKSPQVKQGYNMVAKHFQQFLQKMSKPSFCE